MESYSYYGVITAGVLHDQDLSNDAKVLFAHIAVRCNKMGYCFANNSHFASEEVMNCSKETISRRISLLEKKGHIKTQIIYAEDGKTIKERRIYPLTAGAHINIDTPPIDNPVNTPIDNPVNTPIDNPVNTPIDASVKDNINRDNNTSFNNSLSTKNGERKENFFLFRKRILEECSGKPLAQGVDGYLNDTIISLSKTGYLHNNASGKDLASEDAKAMWAWLFENQEKIGIFTPSPAPVPVEEVAHKEKEVEAEPATPSPSPEPVAVPLASVPSTRPFDFYSLLETGFTFRTANEELFVNSDNFHNNFSKILDKYKPSAPACLAGYFKIKPEIRIRLAGWLEKGGFEEVIEAVGSYA